MVHANQKFEGQNRIDFKTSDGVETVRLQIEAAKNGGGFYSLMFPRPGQTVPVAKIAYAAGFEPWQWSLGTGLYIDDIDAIYSRILKIYLAIVAAVVLVSGAIALALARSISRPISTMAERMGSLAEGDLAVEVPYLEDRNEVGSLARALEVFKQNRRKADELAAAQDAEQAAKLRRQEAVELTLVDFQEQTSRVIAAVVGAAEQVRSPAGGLAEMAQDSR